MTFYFNPCSKMHYCWTILLFLVINLKVFLYPLCIYHENEEFTHIPIAIQCHRVPSSFFHFHFFIAPFPTMRNLAFLVLNLFTYFINLSARNPSLLPTAIPSRVDVPLTIFWHWYPYRPPLCGDAHLIPARSWCSQWVFLTFIQSALISFFMVFY